MTLVSPVDFGSDGLPEDFPRTTDKVRTSTNARGVSATTFAKTMSKAFADATAGGKQFDDVLKQLALRLSGMAVTQAFRPVASGVAGSPSKLIGEIFGSDTETQGKSGSRMPTDMRFMDAIGGLTPFASGGVIGAPTYFPLSSGSLGLAGEAGAEAIMPLMRGPDGRLGVAMNGAGQAANVIIQISTPDAQSFRRSEAYLTGQIARAVMRGQRGF